LQEIKALTAHALARLAVHRLTQATVVHLTSSLVYGYGHTRRGPGCFPSLARAASNSGLGSRLTGKLLRQFGSPECVSTLRSRSWRLAVCPRPRRKPWPRERLSRCRERNWRRCAGQRLRLLHWQETEYPQRLLEIYDPPPLLYVRGDAQVLRRHAIGVVGTRRPTPYGNQIAERVARDLAERGLVIVSGLARGIDSSAHRGACAASRGVDGGRIGMRDRRDLSQGESEIVRRSGTARRDH
jgi:hypothetical protein